MTSTAPIREDFKPLPYLVCTVNQGSPRDILAGVQIERGSIGGSTASDLVAIVRRNDNKTIKQS